MIQRKTPRFFLPDFPGRLPCRWKISCNEMAKNCWSAYPSLVTAVYPRAKFYFRRLFGDRFRNMSSRQRTLAIITALLLAGKASAEIPYPAALDAAAVVESRIADINREALVLGNGDLIGLLWQRSGTLCLRIAKNDIWDARVDTSQDVPLMKVDVPNNKWSGGGYPPSWKKPYPQPRCAAVVTIGTATGESGDWACIRSGGKTNEWLRRDNLGVMSIAGAAGDSAGYRWGIDPAHAGTFTALKLRLSGTPGARFYVNVFTAAGKLLEKSGWRDTPGTEQEVAFPLPAGSTVTAVELYVMTRDGALVENRVRRISFEAGKEALLIPPGMSEHGVKTAKLDLRRAVATVDDTAVRALADRNVFLIETGLEVGLEEIQTKDMPAAELGETAGVKWLHMKLPGDKDYPGMEYALAVAANGTRKIVSLMTSFETKENVRDAAIRLARETAATDTEALAVCHEQEWSRYWSASGVATVGASLTGVTSKLSVFGVGSVSLPPLAVPPSSCTWNVKLA